jgi:hypothetical protein
MPNQNMTQLLVTSVLNIEGSSEGVSEPICTLIVGTTLIWSRLLATKLTPNYGSLLSQIVYT